MNLGIYYAIVYFLKMYILGVAKSHLHRAPIKVKAISHPAICRSFHIRCPIDRGPSEHRTLFHLLSSFGYQIVSLQIIEESKQFRFGGHVKFQR